MLVPEYEKIAALFDSEITGRASMDDLEVFHFMLVSPVMLR
jgi:hypothetical protein